MKQYLTILLVLTMLLCFASCAKAPETPTTSPTVATTLPTEPTESTQQTQPTELPNLPLLTFSAPILSRQHKAEDGALLMTYTYQDFSLILEDPQIADAIVLDLLNYVDYENSAAKSVLADASAAYALGSEWTPFAYSTFFSPERFDQSVLSLYGTHSLYSGSPRPSTASICLTYDLVSGRQLSLQDILVFDFSADVLSQLIVDSLQELSEKGMLFSDYAYVISEMFSTNRPVDSWYLTNTGLCFYFAPYEIAPYSSGIITAEVPYNALTDLLKAEYFPAETEALLGSLSVQSFQDANPDDFTQFAELVMDEGEEQFLLHTDGCVQNLRVELGSWLDDGSFYPEAVVFAAPTLCARDGIVVHAGSDTLQNLRLTYSSSGDTIVLDFHSLLTQS